MKVLITKMDHLGRGITKVNDKVCFVNKALPEDELEIKITKEKSRYLEGEIVKVIKPSPLRITSKCPYFNDCGGCQYFNLSYDNELKIKENIFREILAKYGNVDDSLIKKMVSIDEDFYRNKVTFQVENKKLGFYKYNSKELVPVNKCLLLNKEINKLIKPLREIVKEGNISQIIINVSNDSKLKMVQIRGEVTDYTEMLKLVDVLIINDKVISDKSSITTTLLNNEFILGKETFFQVNKKISERLYLQVIDYIKKLSSKRVLDLYCGVGSISSSISPYAEKVIGIEVSKEAIKNAKKSKELNHIDNIDFIAARVEDSLNVLTSDVDTVIVDPPRSGLLKKVVNELLNSKVQNIIYVSCNPITLARDLKLLGGKYIIKEVIPFNMFLHTYHLESITVLERK
ncbi:MAG: class I SAM-dependent RNA methyltransferase [Bacilli bacterium]|nr:class I SAM-dependent RNA methyltransferase [Bacilli bacterium]